MFRPEIDPVYQQSTYGQHDNAGKTVSHLETFLLLPEKYSKAIGAQKHFSRYPDKKRHRNTRSDAGSDLRESGRKVQLAKAAGFR